MRILYRNEKNRTNFLAKLGFSNLDEEFIQAFLRGVYGEASDAVFELCMSFCSDAGTKQLKKPDLFTQKALSNWLDDESCAEFEVIALTIMQDLVGKLNEVQLEVLQQVCDDLVLLQLEVLQQAEVLG